MSALQKLAWDYASDMAAVGFALDAISDLLGADGNEHFITPAQQNGLIHAVKALGALVHNGAGDLAELSDPDPLSLPLSATQNANSSNRSAAVAGESQ